MKRIKDDLDVLAPVRRRRYFSLNEANRAVVLVKRIVADLIRQHKKLLDIQEMAEAARMGSAVVAEQGARDSLIHCIDRLQVYLQELDDLGVELRDWFTGLVNFPAVVNGREVYFSWQPGEECISWWEEFCPVAEGRQPIDTFPMLAGAR